MTIRATGLCLLLALSCAVLADVASGSAEARCDRSYLLSDPDRAIEPGVLVGASAEVPAHCRVRGVIDGTIRFEVTMPVDGWRGRMMFHAVGGSAGRIGDTTSLLEDGFAMASTDAGHEGNAPDANAFFRDPLAVINYGYRAVHLSTVAAKEIIGAFYGADNRHAYIWGCSNGGRAVLNALLRFPEDYDGAIAGAPATDQMRELLPWSVATARLQRANPLTPESLALLDANSRNRCDLLDGLEDGVIGLPEACTTDMLRLEDLRCEEGRTAGCLTAGQFETARAIYDGISDGISDGSGRTVSPGVVPGGEGDGDWMLWVTGNPGFMGASASEASTPIVEHLLHRDPGFRLDEFDVVEDRQALAAAGVAVDLPPGDFSSFESHGGKLIVYQGWSDFPLRPQLLLDYLDAAEDLTGGPETMAGFHRLYMVPGMLHCTGGPGAWAADYVRPIVDWVEEDRAPGEIVAAQPGITNWFEASAAGAGSADWYDAVMRAGAEKAEQEGARRFTRPLCPYPQYATYDGSGDPNDAASFACGVDDPAKVSFASGAWFDMARSVIKTFAAENPTLNLKINEVFTDVPARLDPGPDGKVAYVMEFRNGEADLWLEELPASEVDIKVVGRWAALLPAALYVVDEDSPRSVATYRKIGQRNLESGDVVVEISPDFQGSGGNELHNRLATRTRP